MKRSKKATLLLMAPIAATFILAGCAEEPIVDALVFKTPEECAASSTLSAEQCKTDYEQAKKLSANVAPKYANKAECEVDFGVGKCETAPTTTAQQQSGSSGFFMPMMMGYMMGQMFNRQGGAGQAFDTRSSSTSNTRSNFAPQPLYKSRDDSSTFRTATNSPVSRHTGLVPIRSSQTQPKATSLTQRGGFGSQAATRSMRSGG